ncbi:MAG: hypothetical protein M1816_001946 [Peltula sp. TS41687]|nr:MAG: hypothetical protein M1816_001946 [Peltula sp. TS41687]
MSNSKNNNNNTTSRVVMVKSRKDNPNTNPSQSETSMTEPQGAANSGGGGNPPLPATGPLLSSPGGLSTRNRRPRPPPIDVALSRTVTNKLEGATPLSAQVRWILVDYSPENLRRASWPAGTNAGKVSATVATIEEGRNSSPSSDAGGWITILPPDREETPSPPPYMSMGMILEKPNADENESHNEISDSPSPPKEMSMGVLWENPPPRRPRRNGIAHGTDSASTPLYMSMAMILANLNADENESDNEISDSPSPPEEMSMGVLWENPPTHDVVDASPTKEVAKKK